MSAKTDAMRMWHDIETAPRDGSVFIGLEYNSTDDPHACLMQWDGWWEDTAFCREQNPTHWMPYRPPAN